MVLRKKVKVVCFLSPRLVEQYSALSETFGITKSELYRKTLERGFKSTSEWCEAALSPVAATAPAVVAAPRTPRPSLPSKAPSAGASPVLDLGKFAEALVHMQPEIERPVFESMVTAQGRVLGWVRLFCVDGPERADGFCDQHGKSYLTRRRRGGGGGGSTGGTIPSP